MCPPNTLSCGQIFYLGQMYLAIVSYTAICLVPHSTIMDIQSAAIHYSYLKVSLQRCILPQSVASTAILQELSRTRLFVALTLPLLYE